MPRRTVCAVATPSERSDPPFADVASRRRVLLTSSGEWLAAYEQARYDDELEFTTVQLDSIGADEDQVTAAIGHPRACDLARELQSIGGSQWQCVDTDYAYAILENHEDLTDELEAEGYHLNLDEYEEP